MSFRDQLKEAVEPKAGPQATSLTDATNIVIANRHDQPKQDHMSFAMFAKLPRKVRRKIWGFAANVQRTVDFHAPSAGTPALWTTCPSPSILAVNVEARKEGLKHYSHLSTSSMVNSIKAPRLYFNFNVDTVLLSLSDKDGDPAHPTSTADGIFPKWVWMTVNTNDIAKFQRYTITEPAPTNTPTKIVYDEYFTSSFSTLLVISKELKELIFSPKRERGSSNATLWDALDAMTHFYVTNVYINRPRIPGRVPVVPKMLIEGLSDNQVLRKVVKLRVALSNRK